jgi:hypothetical protein
MRPEHWKMAAVGGWMLACGVIAWSVDVRSPGGWILLVALAILPPLMGLRMWHQSTKTMSESIHDVLK